MKKVLPNAIPSPEMGIPILGICYGMQLIGHLLGGEVAHSEKREYGKAKLTIDQSGKTI